MEAINIFIGLLTCGLVGGAIAYGELHMWRGLAAVGLYSVAGLMASELIAAPAMWDLLGLRSGVVESLAMALALAVGLWRVCRLAAGAGGQDAAD